MRCLEFQIFFPFPRPSLLDSLTTEHTQARTEARPSVVAQWLGAAQSWLFTTFPLYGSSGLYSALRSWSRLRTATLNGVDCLSGAKGAELLAHIMHLPEQSNNTEAGALGVVRVNNGVQTRKGK